MTESKRSRPVKTITVASGKGGVGKTNIVANLAIALRQMGKEVLVFDADLGLSNIDVVLNLAPKYNIQHVLSGEKTLAEVIIEGPYGIKILPATSGVQEITSLDEFQQMMLVEAFDAYEGDIDVLLVDSAAGISANVAFFCSAAQEIVVVTSPEPTALTDAYALIKVLYTSYQEKHFRVIVNSVRDQAEALDVFKKLSMAAERFLSISLDYLGFIPFDDSLRKSVRMQKAVVERFPMSPSARQLKEIASRLNSEEISAEKGSIQFFWNALLKGRTSGASA